MAPTALRALAVRGPYRGASGHDHHVREFVRHLAARGIRLQLEDLPEWGPTRLPDDLCEPWFDTLGDPVGAATTLHFCMPHQVRAAAGRLTVNYTMFEASRIPERWRALGRRHDLVVVPTESSRAAWLEAGQPSSRIAVCPLGVDGERFRPDAEPLDLGAIRDRPVRGYRTRVLNVSEPVPRKNLIALLRVWITATSPRDDAVLIVKVGRAPVDGAVRLMRDLAGLEQQLGRSRHDAAPVVFTDRILSDRAMPGLFAAATHYWSMSHGEGWDQPMVEAAATGLRLLAPAHSAYLSYLDAAIARLIPARPVAAAVEGDPDLARLFAGAEWWQPDETAAAAALREAIGGADADRPSARERVTGTLTWPRAARRLIEILGALEADRGRVPS